MEDIRNDVVEKVGVLLWSEEFVVEDGDIDDDDEKLKKGKLRWRVK